MPVPRCRATTRSWKAASHRTGMPSALTSASRWQRRSPAGRRRSAWTPRRRRLVGAFANGGAEWRPAGDPEQVNVHDFIDKELGKAIPYGVHDIAADTGWVSVGTDADTAQFAVSTLRTWWNRVGKPAYPHASRLLIPADSGGSTATWPSRGRPSP